MRGDPLFLFLVHQFAGDVLRLQFDGSDPVGGDRHFLIHFGNRRIILQTDAADDCEPLVIVFNDRVPAEYDDAADPGSPVTFPLHHRGRL